MALQVQADGLAETGTSDRVKSDASLLTVGPLLS